MSTNIVREQTGKPERSRASRSVSLPVKGKLGLAYALSLVITTLAAAAALTSLVLPGAVYTTDEVLLSFLPVDLFHLSAGLPVLLASMWLARRGRLDGLLCWPGALLYVLYSYITNLLGVPFGVLFVPYLLLVALSAYTTIGLVASIDGEAVRARLGGAVPVRAVAGLLVGLSGLFAVMNLRAIFIALSSQPPALPEHPLFVLIADFTTVIPLCLVGGYLLWRRAALGYVAAVGLLLFYTLLLIGLVPALAFPAFYNGTPVAMADIVLMLSFGLLCLFLLARFVRAAGAGNKESTLPG